MARALRSLGTSMFGALSFEDIAKLVVILFLLGWNVTEGAIFENEYPNVFVRLYPVAAWRLLLLAALIAGTYWSVPVGLMLAYATFFYVMDMEVTMDKWK